MASLGTLTLDLVAKTSGFVQGMSKAERASAKWRKKVKRDIQQVSSTLKTGLKVGSVAAAAGLTIIINRSRQVIDEQAKMAQRLNTTSASLATLKRATDRTGLSMKVIETASRTLEINLGRASQGMAAQKTAVDRLGLSIEDISKLPLDERIKVINKALRESVPEFERTAVAADLFGSRGAAAIQQLDPDTLRAAAEEAQVFGLALSEIDAAKVENANDSFSRISAAASGAGQQLTVAFAPALDAIGNAFFEAAKDAGGFGDVTQAAMDKGVRAVAFLVNAADGVDRAFEFAGKGIAVSVLGWKGVALEAARAVIDAYDSLPFTERSAELAGITQAISLNNAAIAEGTRDIRDLLMKPLAGNALVAEYEKAKIAAQEAAEATVATRVQRQGGSIPTLPTPVDEVTSSTNAIRPDDEFLQPQEDFVMVFGEREKAFQEHKDNMVAIEEATNGQLSGAAKNLLGEQSGIYQAIFAIEKGAAIARSIIAIQTGIAQAAASGPFPANLAAMASVASATAGLVSTIASTSVQGQAHDGLMSVPTTGTYILEKGERVTTAETSAKMDGLIDEARSGGGGNVSVVAALGDSEIEKWLGSKTGERMVLAHIRRNQSTVQALARA